MRENKDFPDQDNVGAEDPQPRFLADCMLGRLARWLRILGCDTWYFRDISDQELVQLQRRSGRVLLTRDRGLVLRRGIGKAVFIEKDAWADQMEEVLKVFPLLHVSDRMFTRCIRCNTLLEEMAPGEVRGRVPDFVAGVHNRFRGCPSCGRVYWPGTHRDGMSRVVERFAVGGRPSTES